MHDLSCHCFNNNCDGEQLLTFVEKMTKITRALKDMYALMIGAKPTDDQHLWWFDLYSEVGMALGKIFRYILEIDPKKYYDC